MAKRKKPVDAVTAYATEVAEGRTVASRLVRLACQRHLSDLEDGPSRGLKWRPDKAQDAIDFFEKVLCLPDVGGDTDDGGAVESVPFLLRPFQKFIVGSLFGWHAGNGKRRFRVAYVETGKGSGKTPLAAGIALYGLVVDGGKGAQIFAAAVTEKQAKLAFTDAENMVKASPELDGKQDGIVDSKVNNLSVLETGAFFRPISSEKRGLDGKRVYIAIIDEVHEHPDANVVDKMRAGTKGRKNALIFMITNSGYDRSSVCWREHEYSRQMLQGTLKADARFAFICHLDSCDACYADGHLQPNEKCEHCDRWDVEGPHWLKANPCLGFSLTWEYLREQVEEAVGMPAKQNIVRRLNFCVWTSQNTKLINPTEWSACSIRVPDAELIGVPCYGGIDLGQTDDFSAWLMIWALEDGRVAVRCRFWIPEQSVLKYPDRPYDLWRQAGLLSTTEGNITDYDVIQDAIADDCDRWGVREVAYDKRFAQQMALNLQGKGITMVDTPQGFQLTEAINKMMEIIAAHSLSHGGDSILSWMASNVAGKHGRDKQIRIDKEASGDKIDGISALVMAISRWIAQEPDEGESVYESRGLVSL